MKMPAIQEADRVTVIHAHRARVLDIFSPDSGRLAAMPLTAAQRDEISKMKAAPDRFMLLSVETTTRDHEGRAISRMLLAVDIAGKWQSPAGDHIEIVAAPEAQNGGTVSWPTTVGAMRAALAEFPHDMPIRIPVKWQDDDDDVLEQFRVWKHLEQVLISP